MAEVTFVLKDPSAKPYSLVIGLFRYGNKRIKFSTNEKINPLFWDKSTKRVRKTREFPEHSEFNTRLDHLQKEIKDRYRRFKNDFNKEPDTEEFKKEIRGVFNKDIPVKNELNLFSFIEKFIEESKSRINDKTGRTFSNSTINIYKNTYRLLQNFKKEKRTRVEFDTIDLDFYQDFSEYLTKDLGFSNNTIGKHIKTVKTFLNDATERGINKHIAYKSKRFKVITEETDSIYLNAKEIGEIYQLDLSQDKKLERVRDLFIVGCWTGLRFSDFSRITPKNIQGGFIEIETQKTGQTVAIPIHSMVTHIMEKYKRAYENSLPPAISNVKMNEYLKEIASKVPSLLKKETVSITKGGINRSINRSKYELVTSHTARRSFASNQYEMGIPAITIMQITGHKTEKAFMRYIKLTSKEHAKIMKMHWDKQLKVV